MTDPATTFEPVWGDPASVIAWLQLKPATTEQQALMADVVAACEPIVQRCRPEGWDRTDPEHPVYVPTADIWQGMRHFAARVWTRRNTPSGIENFTDTITFVAQYDPEVRMFLRMGRPRAR